MNSVSLSHIVCVFLFTYPCAFVFVLGLSLLLSFHCFVTLLCSPVLCLISDCPCQGCGSWTDVNLAYGFSLRCCYHLSLTCVLGDQVTRCQRSVQVWTVSNASRRRIEIQSLWPCSEVVWAVEKKYLGVCTQMRSGLHLKITYSTDVLRISGSTCSFTCQQSY